MVLYYIQCVLDGIVLNRIESLVDGIIYAIYWMCIECIVLYWSYCIVLHYNTVNMKILALGNYSGFLKSAVFLMIAPGIFSDFFLACV